MRVAGTFFTKFGAMLAKAQPTADRELIVADTHNRCFKSRCGLLVFFSPPTPWTWGVVSGYQLGTITIYNRYNPYDASADVKSYEATADHRQES
jgi:hypothetical protein